MLVSACLVSQPKLNSILLGPAAKNLFCSDELNYLLEKSHH